MILYCIQIETSDKGVATNAFTVHNDGDPVERRIAGILDIGVKLAMECVAIHQSKAMGGKHTQILEGKDIEKFVRKGLAEIDVVSMKDALKACGFKLPSDESGE